MKKLAFKRLVPLIFIFLLALLLRLYQLDKLMLFHGDQAWFYISAKDAIINREIPLVGLTASRTWLHQGAFWTYILMPILWISNFHPIAPGVLTSLVGAITVVAMYLVAKKMFNTLTGFTAALLFATSPILIVHARTPYHTSFDPLLSIGILYFTYSIFLKKNVKHLPLLAALCTIVYNFNIAATTLWIFVGVSLVISVIKNRPLMKKITQPDTLLKTGIAATVPMIPFILYDLNNDFNQTVKFFGWFVTRPLHAISSLFTQMSTGSLQSMTEFFVEEIRYLVFAPSPFVAVVILGFSIGFLATLSYKQGQKTSWWNACTMLLLFVGIVASGVFANMTASNIYMHVLYAPILLVIAVAISHITHTMSSVLKFAMYSIVTLIVLINIYSLIQTRYLYDKPGRVDADKTPTFQNRLEVAQNIVESSNGRPYILKGSGPGADFESFTLNTEYLAWWLGHEPVGNPQDAEVLFEIIQKNGVLTTRSFYTEYIEQQ